MPQSTAAPAARASNGETTSNGETPVPHVELLKDIASKSPDDRTSAEKQIARAIRLESERAEVMKRIASNREYLRLMEENEELTDAEADWLEDFYPQKEKGASRTDEEIERTRKAKAAARAAKP